SGRPERPPLWLWHGGETGPRRPSLELEVKGIWLLLDRDYQRRRRWFSELGRDPVGVTVRQLLILPGLNRDRVVPRRRATPVAIAPDLVIAGGIDQAGGLIANLAAGLEFLGGEGDDPAPEGDVLSKGDLALQGIRGGDGRPRRWIMPTPHQGSAER